MNNSLAHRINSVSRALLLGAAMLAGDAFFAAPNANAYVARRTTVSGPGGGTYHRTTVAGAGGAYHRTAVAGAGGGYYSRTAAVGAGGVYGHRAAIYALPTGYRPVYVGGVRYYTVGGVYYRPIVQGGRTAYVVTTVH